MSEPRIDSTRLAVIKTAAENRDPQYMLALGTLYLHGLEGVPKSTTRGVGWLNRVARLESSVQWQAELALGQHYYRAAEYPKALKFLRRASGHGSGAAAAIMAAAYETGSGVERDPAESKRWLGIAEDSGDPTFRAVYNDYSMVVREDEVEALRKRATGGELAAQLKLGHFYSQSPGEPGTAAAEAEEARDSEEALRWYSRAAAQGDTDAMISAAELLLGEVKEGEDPDRTAEGVLETDEAKPPGDGAQDASDVLGGEAADVELETSSVAASGLDEGKLSEVVEVAAEDSDGEYDECAEFEDFTDSEGEDEFEDCVDEALADDGEAAVSEIAAGEGDGAGEGADANGVGEAEGAAGVGEGDSTESAAEATAGEDATGSDGSAAKDAAGADETACTPTEPQAGPVEGGAEGESALQPAAPPLPRDTEGRRQQAIAWYKKAAELEHATGQYAYGVHLFMEHCQSQVSCTRLPSRTVLIAPPPPPPPQPVTTADGERSDDGA